MQTIEYWQLAFKGNLAPYGPTGVVVYGFVEWRRLGFVDFHDRREYSTTPNSQHNYWYYEMSWCFGGIGW